MKRIYSAVSILLFLGFFVFFQSGIVEARKVIKLAHVCTEEDIFHIQSVKFKELVESATKGKLRYRSFRRDSLEEKKLISSAWSTQGP